MTVQAEVGVGEVDSMDDVVVVVDAELVVGTVLVVDAVVVDDDSGDSVGSEPEVNMTS